MQIGLPLSGRSIFVITRMIIDRIGLHSFLELLTTWLTNVINGLIFTPLYHEKSPAQARTSQGLFT